MDKIRIGKDIAFVWKVLTNGEEQDLKGRDIKVVIYPLGGGCHKVIHHVADGCKLRFAFLGCMQEEVGTYNITVWENYGKRGQNAFDYPKAFALVDSSTKEHKDGLTSGDLEIETIDLGVASMVVGIPGLSHYEIALNNGFVGTEKEWLDTFSEPARKAAEELTSKFDKTSKRLEDKYLQTVTLLDLKYKNSADALKTDYETAKGNLNADYENVKKKLDDLYLQTKNTLALEYDVIKKNLANEYSAKVAALATDYNSVKQNLSNDYTQTKDNLTRDVEALESRLNTAITSANNAVQGIDAKLNEYKTQIETKYSNLTAQLISDYAQKQKEIVDKANEKINEVQSEVGKIQPALDKMQQDFTSSQTQRTNAFGTEQTQRTQQFNQQISQQDATFQSKEATRDAANAAALNAAEKLNDLGLKVDEVDGESIYFSKSDGNAKKRVFELYLEGLNDLKEYKFERLLYASSLGYIQGRIYCDGAEVARTADAAPLHGIAKVSERNNSGINGYIVYNIDVEDNVNTQPIINNTIVSNLVYSPFINLYLKKIDKGDLVNESVIKDKIADNAVVSSKIADNAVVSSKIADNAVVSSKIADNSVGHDKLDFFECSRKFGTTKELNELIFESYIPNADINKTYIIRNIIDYEGIAVRSVKIASVDEQGAYHDEWEAPNIYEKIDQDYIFIALNPVNANSGHAYLVLNPKSSILFNTSKYRVALNIIECKDDSKSPFINSIIGNKENTYEFNRGEYISSFMDTFRRDTITDDFYNYTIVGNVQKSNEKGLYGDSDFSCIYKSVNKDEIAFTISGNSGQNTILILNYDGISADAIRFAFTTSTAKVSVYTSKMIGSNTNFNLIGTFPYDRVVCVEKLSNKIIVSNAFSNIIEIPYYKELKNVGFAFTNKFLCSVNSFSILKKKAWRKIDLQRIINNGTIPYEKNNQGGDAYKEQGDLNDFYYGKIFRFSPRVDDKNNIIGSFVSESARIRSEIKMGVLDENNFSTRCKFSADVYLRSEYNSNFDKYDYSLFQIHNKYREDDSYRFYENAPVLAVIIENGLIKYLSYQSQNEGFPPSEDNIAEERKFNLSPIILDRWFTLSVEFVMAGDKSFLPYIIIRIDNQVVLKYYEANKFLTNTPDVVHIGVYARGWSNEAFKTNILETDNTERRVYMKNVSVEY